MILENIATISEKYRPRIGHLIPVQTSDWLIYAALKHDHVSLFFTSNFFRYVATTATYIWFAVMFYYIIVWYLFAT